MRLQEYHHTIWLPFSKAIDKHIKGVPVLWQLKKLFDAHFTLLSLVGIIAPPKDDLDCYVYIFKRYPNGKYRDLNYKERLKRSWHLFLWCLR